MQHLGGSGTHVLYTGRTVLKDSVYNIYGNGRHYRFLQMYTNGGPRKKLVTLNTLHVHTCSGRNRIIPSMRRTNTDSTPNKPVTLPRNQRLIR